jgi:hypothetical protein
MSIVYYKLARATKYGKNIGFHEIHDHLVSGIPSGQNLDPLGEIVGGSENPLVFPTEGWIYITY